MLDISAKKEGHFFMIHKSRCELIWMMGLYLDCVDVKELWVLKMKKNVPYDLSLLIVNTTDKLYLIVAIPEMPPFGMI